LMAFAQTPMQLLVLRIGQGVFSGFLAPSITLVTLAFPSGHTGRISGILQSAMAGGSVLGPLFGSLLIQTLPARFMFATPAILAGLAALLVWIFAREAELPAQAPRAGRPMHRLGLGVLIDVAKRIGSLVQRPGMKFGLGFLFVAQFGIGATNPQLELFVGYIEPGWDAAKVQQHTAYLFSVLAVLGFFAMPAWGRFGDRRGHGLVLMLSAAGTGLGLVLGGLATAFWVLLASRLLLGAFATGLGPAAFGLAAEVTDREELGAANGAVFSARAMAMALGSMLGGALVNFLGLRGVYYAAGALLLLSALFGRSRLRLSSRAS
jgi:DHA1 family multidrug resistance protein-like MFS transporter